MALTLGIWIIRSISLGRNRAQQVDVGLEPNALVLRLPDLRVQLLELFDRNILVVLERDRILLFLVFLQLFLGSLELLFQFVGFVAEEIVGDPRQSHALFDRLAHEFLDDRFGDQLGALRTRVRHGHVYEAGPAADAGRDERPHPIGDLRVRVGFGTRGEEFRIVEQIGGLGHAHQERIAGQRRDNGRHVIRRLQPDGLVRSEHHLLLLLDLNDGGGRILLRLTEREVGGHRTGDDHDQQEQPDVTKQQMQIVSDVETGSGFALASA